MSNGEAARIVGGSPVAVVVRLIVVSFIVGVVLAAFGFEPETMIDDAVETVRHLVRMGLLDFHEFGRILLTGAMVVVPVWVVLRFLDARRGG